MSSTFESRHASVLGSLADSAGVKKGALAILMSVLAPVIMRTIGKQVRDRNLDAKGLQTYLGGQRSAIASVLPSPLAKMLDTEHIAPAPYIARSARVFSVRVVASSAGVVEQSGALCGLSWLLSWWRWRCSRWLGPDVGPPAITPTPAPGARGQRSPDHRAASPMAPSVEMPSEPAIGGGPREDLGNPSAGGVQALALYLASGGASGQKNDFVLEGVTFRTASATLSKEGTEKVHELAALMKGHPGAKIKVVGHTDNAGNPEANRVLSEDRATAVRDELIRQGIAPDRIETAGAGSDDPVAKNDSTRQHGEEPPHRRDRRVAVVSLLGGSCPNRVTSLMFARGGLTLGA